jgi:hypothetical protein
LARYNAASTRPISVPWLSAAPTSAAPALMAFELFRNLIDQSGAAEELHPCSGCSLFHGTF